MKMPVFATNRKARYDYDIGQKIEAGVELLGHEVKSVRNGRITLTGSYAIIKNGELWLLNASIPPYQPSNVPEYSPERTRKLLVSAKELQEILRKTEAEKLVIVPLSVYSQKRRVKIELGLGRPRKSYDKREAIKKRDMGREIGRRLK